MAARAGSTASLAAAGVALFDWAFAAGAKQIAAGISDTSIPYILFMFDLGILSASWESELARPRFHTPLSGVRGASKWTEFTAIYSGRAYKLRRNISSSMYACGLNVKNISHFNFSNRIRFRKSAGHFSGRCLLKFNGAKKCHRKSRGRNTGE